MESKKNESWNTETKRIGDQTMKDLRAYEDYLEDMTQNNAKSSRDDKWIMNRVKKKFHPTRSRY